MWFLITSPGAGGLDLSQNGLNWDSRSRQRKKVSLDSWENLDSFKKLVLMIKISRLRNLNFALTPPSSPKSLNREICWDMIFLANLNCLPRSRSRVSQFYHISQSRFLHLSRYLILKYLKKSWQISKILTVSICLENLYKYLDEDKSRSKNLDFKNLDREKKSRSWRDG
jgi:hypothetical protein